MKIKWLRLACSQGGGPEIIVTNGESEDVVLVSPQCELDPCTERLLNEMVGAWNDRYGVEPIPRCPVCNIVLSSDMECYYCGYVTYEPH